jgi:hypothetical protein
VLNRTESPRRSDLDAAFRLSPDDRNGRAPKGGHAPVHDKQQGTSVASAPSRALNGGCGSPQPPRRGEGLSDLAHDGGTPARSDSLTGNPVCDSIATIGACVIMVALVVIAFWPEWVGAALAEALR